MCAVSMVGDHYTDKWKDWPLDYPTYPGPGIPWPGPVGPYIPSVPSEPNPYLPGAAIGAATWPTPQVTKQEFDALKREVEDMKALLIRAKKYDEENGEPNCEMDEKVALLKRIAEFVGVSLEEVFGQK